MSERTPTRFRITYTKGAYYVSIPNYAGGEVVDAAVADALAKALQDIIWANNDFRAGMPKDWEGDPLQDAINDAAKLLPAVVGGSSK